MRRLVVTAFAVCVVAGSALATAAGAQSAPPERVRAQHLVERARAAFAASAGTHAVHDPNGPATLSKGSVTDPRGDAGDSRADITRVSASYNATTVSLSLKVVQPTNPKTDPAWTSDNGAAGAQWGIDTTGDENPEYVAFFEAGANGRLVADIVGNNDDFTAGQVCKGAAPRYTRGTYIVTAPASCLGSAPNIWVAAFMVYIPDFDGDVGGIDLAPDDSFFGPLAGPPGGYLMAAADGGVFTYGRVKFSGSLGQLSLTTPIVDVAATVDLKGYVMLGGDGGVFTFGKSRFGGSAAGLHPDGRFVAIASTPDGGGYWVATSEGAVLSLGNARFFGSTAGFDLGTTVVDMAATRTGRGYWLVTANGGVLAFGDAKYEGSAATLPLRSPIVALAPTSTGRGYLLIAADGGVFTYGDASFHGSTGALHLTSPIVDVAMSASGRGYRLVAADGGVFAFGDATFFGSAATLPLRSPIVAVASL
jgi:hypothetical protein